MPLHNLCSHFGMLEFHSPFRLISSSSLMLYLRQVHVISSLIPVLNSICLQFDERIIVFKLYVVEYPPRNLLLPVHIHLLIDTTWIIGTLCSLFRHCVVFFLLMNAMIRSCSSAQWQKWLPCWIGKIKLCAMVHLFAIEIISSNSHDGI